MSKQILLVEPRGFCAGVERSIKILDWVVEKAKTQVYVRHQIIHNNRVIEDYEKKGVKFVESLDEVPNGSIVVMSAHGTAPEIINVAKRRQMKVIDAVCPLVTKVHMEAKRLADDGYFVIYIGHKGHQEAIGVLGEVPVNRSVLIEGVDEIDKWKRPKDAKKIGVVTQTTLHADESLEMVNRLKQRFPDLKLPLGGDICYATKGRQGAVMELARRVDIVLVVGSKTSSNSNKLKDRAEEQGVKSYLVDDKKLVKKEWFEGVENVGITAGASGPDYLIQEVVEKVEELFGGEVRELVVGRDEVKFGNLPEGLRLL
ncbi:MAG: 4-hydroxy-3-methylbut-2-enyl diphosphate reductase [Candidatus Beckwithbacteria bacterium]